MSPENLAARIETVRRKIGRWQRTAERRKTSNGLPSKNYVQACLAVQRYKSELAHLAEQIGHARSRR